MNSSKLASLSLSVPFHRFDVRSRSEAITRIGENVPEAAATERPHHSGAFSHSRVGVAFPGGLMERLTSDPTGIERVVEGADHEHNQRRPEQQVHCVCAEGLLALAFSEYGGRTRSV